HLAAALHGPLPEEPGGIGPGGRLERPGAGPYAGAAPAYRGLHRRALGHHGPPYGRVAGTHPRDLDRRATAGPGAVRPRAGVLHRGRGRAGEPVPGGAGRDQRALRVPPVDHRARSPRRRAGSVSVPTSDLSTFAQRQHTYSKARYEMKPMNDSGVTRRLARTLSLALVASLVLSACGNDGMPQAEARAGGPGQGPGGGFGGRATPVSARVVVPGDLEVTLRASTNLRARQQVDVVPKQAGNVVRVLVEEGARVTEGQALAQLDDAELRLQADQAEARAVAATEAAERARSLQAMSLVSEQEVERLVSEARVAEAELGLARLRVDNAQIRAPIAGTVTHRYVERGQ